MIYPKRLIFKRCNHNPQCVPKIHQIPIFICPECGGKMTLIGGGGPDEFGVYEPPDGVMCNGCKYADDIDIKVSFGV